MRASGSESAAEQQTLEASGLFSRTDPDSPFAGASFVYVPYCTGDVHAASTVQDHDVGGQTETVHHTGGLNAQVIVDAVHATLPALSRISRSGRPGLDHGPVRRSGPAQ